VVVLTTPAWSFKDLAFNARSEFSILVKEADALEPASVELAILEENRSSQAFLFGRELDEEFVRRAIECAIGHAARSGAGRFKVDHRRSNDVAAVEREALDDWRHFVADQFSKSHNPILVVVVSNLNHGVPSRAIRRLPIQDVEAEKAQHGTKPAGPDGISRPVYGRNRFARSFPRTGGLGRYSGRRFSYAASAVGRVLASACASLARITRSA